MTVLVVLPLVVAIGVLLDLYAGRRRRRDGYRPLVPSGGPPEDRDRQRLMAELRALGAADPPRLLD